MASIKDVAKKAGVSISTVSRTMSDHNSISDKTKKKVWKVIKDLQYSPNAMAQSLSNSRSYNITLLVNIDDVRSFNNIFFYEMMHGIESVVYEKEYSLTIANVNDDEKYGFVFDKIVRSKKTDGLILPAAIFKEEWIDELKTMGIPYVLIGEVSESDEDLFWVDINNKKAGIQATKHLLEKKCKKIAYIGYEEKNTFNKRRLEGFESVMNKKGFSDNEYIIIKGEKTKEEGYRIANILLEEDAMADGIICADSYLVLGLLQCFKEKSIKVPEEVKVISFDSPQIAELSYPKITTVDADVFELGARATKLLFELLDTPERNSEEILVSTRVEERETT